MKIDWDDEDTERDQKRSELVESAALLFRKKGFKKTKLEDIAAPTQKGKTALYYYFKNKKSIFAAVIEWEISKVYLALESYTLNGATLATFKQGELPKQFDSRAALLRYVEKIVDIGDSLLRLHKNIFSEYATFQKLIQSTIKAFKEQNMLLLVALLEYGRAQGSLPLQKEDIELAAYAIFRMCFTYFSDIMQGIDFQIGKEELQNIILRFFVQDSPSTADRL